MQTGSLVHGDLTDSNARAVECGMTPIVLHFV
jgi:hypothetical protein